MSSRLFQWLRISFFNLLLVAVLGFVLRYKIVYSLPFIDQKHLLHAHSHFAFTGWITQALMALMIATLSKQKQVDLFPKYRWLLYANLITAYGMLFSFPIQGYGFFSISFSTLSIFTSWIFAVVCWKEINSLPAKTLSGQWFKAALFFNALSALGAFSLAFMMANKIIHQNWYLLAIYFFLHFQYNGWFFFGCMGLFVAKLSSLFPDDKKIKTAFWLFAGSCFPAYFLSALWLTLPVWLYVVVIISAIAQLAGWIRIINIIIKNEKKPGASLPAPAKWLLLFSSFALTVKLFLQLASTIPYLSTLAFGYRPIVIAYLHLILLGVITLFLLGYLMGENVLPRNKKVMKGTIIFTAAIIFNEFLLMIQGVTAISYIMVPYINELLLLAASLLFTGILLLNLGIKKQT